MPQVKVTKVPAVEDRTLPVFAEMDRLMEAIRCRAYALFEQRGCTAGRDFDDWLAAERELCRPTAELKESDEQFTLEVALAGFEPGEVAVTATPRELIVRALHESRREPGPKPKKDEARWPGFLSDEVYRRIELPVPIDVEKVDARMRSGLLEVVAPKAKLSAVSVLPVKEAA